MCDLVPGGHLAFWLLPAPASGAHLLLELRLLCGGEIERPQHCQHRYQPAELCSCPTALGSRRLQLRSCSLQMKKGGRRRAGEARGEAEGAIGLEKNLGARVQGLTG
ncbi:unnamed protein product [Urochloa humidicola]